MGEGPRRGVVLQHSGQGTILEGPGALASDSEPSDTDGLKGKHPALRERRQGVPYFGDIYSESEGYFY